MSRPARKSEPDGWGLRDRCRAELRRLPTSLVFTWVNRWEMVVEKQGSGSLIACCDEALPQLLEMNWLPWEVEMIWFDADCGVWFLRLHDKA